MWAGTTLKESRVRLASAVMIGAEWGGAVVLAMRGPGGGVTCAQEGNAVKTDMAVMALARGGAASRRVHLGSVTNPPDLDYVINISLAPMTNGRLVGIFKKDPAGLLEGGDDLAAGFFANEASIVIFKMNMTAYRPRTEGPGANNPFARHAVPEDLEESPGAGIRINGDNDNRNGFADWQETTVNNENDTIEVVLQAEPFFTPGLVYALKRDNSNIKVWTAQNKGQALLGANHETNLSFSSHSKTVWVECPTGGVADLEFEARTTNGTVICSDKVHFYPFSSIAIGLSGEVWPGWDYLDNGMYAVSQELYENGYDIHYYDEDVVDANGAGVAFNEITNAIRNRVVTRVAIFGHSHGGGSTHDLAARLHTNRVAIGVFTIDFTGYVDAIENDSDYDDDSELRLPPSTSYHMNYYQTNGWPRGGPVPGANENLNVNTTQWGHSLKHGAIDNDTNVIRALRDRIIQQMPQP